MSTDSRNAFLLSATLHGSVVVLVLLFSFVAGRQAANAPRILELVAGEGNNYSATVAPALGSDSVMKLTLPTAPKAAPIPAVRPEPVPVPPPPTAVKPAPKSPAETKVPNISRDLRRAMIIADSKAKQQVARARAAEQKRLATEAADRAKKEESDRVKKAKADAAAAPKYTKIDAVGIAKGVVGGSTDNKVGGAGGKALVSEEGTALERYFSLLIQRLQEALVRPSGLSDTLVATVEFRIAADGTLSGAHIIKRSGSPEFDEAAIETFSLVKSIGARPDRKSDLRTVDFKMREE